MMQAIEMIICKLIFYINFVNHKDFLTSGLPYVSIALGGKCSIDTGFKMNNGLKSNPIGRAQPCILFVDRGASLVIGKNVGISSVAIVAHHSITISDNVKIGGGVCIYDTDFHSLNADVRLNASSDQKAKKCLPVLIGSNVFIGAHSTILKGVTIGENSVVGACSVVTKTIPANEVWAGNPARYIKSVIL